MLGSELALGTQWSRLRGRAAGRLPAADRTHGACTAIDGHAGTGVGGCRDGKEVIPGRPRMRMLPAGPLEDDCFPLLNAEESSHRKDTRHRGLASRGGHSHRLDFQANQGSPSQFLTDTFQIGAR